MRSTSGNSAIEASVVRREHSAIPVLVSFDRFVTIWRVSGRSHHQGEPF